MISFYPKYLIILILAGFSLLVGGCAHDEVEIPDNVGIEMDTPGMKQVGLRFNIILDPTAETRTPRPLESDEATHKLTDLRIYVFHSESGVEGTFTYYRPIVKDKTTGEETIVGYFHIDKFSVESAEAEEPTNFATYIVHPKLDKGYYRFIAVGSDRMGKDISGNIVEDSADNFNMSFAANSTTWEEAKILNNENVAGVNEIFVGYNATAEDDKPYTIHVRNGESFIADLTMKRAVAGVIMSVVNIPKSIESDFQWNDEQGNPVVAKGAAQYPVTKVAIVSSLFSKELLLTKSAISDINVDNNSYFNQWDIAGITIPSGAKEEAGYYESDAEGNPFLKGEFIFPSRLKLPVATEEGEETYEPENAPLALSDTAASLYLCLYTTIGGTNYVVKALPVKLVRSNPYEATRYSEADVSIEQNGRSFNLIGNNLYCLGTKEHPLDLKEKIKHPELEIIVIGNWQADIDIEL